MKPLTQPRRVFLFSGHMVDKPDRDVPRFPDAKSTLVADAIEKKLTELDATDKDLAICSAACGGDLLFAQSCLQRGMNVHLHLAFDEREFLEKSVDFAGEKWKQRYVRVRSDVKSMLIILPVELRRETLDANAFARNNVRMLDEALAFGGERVFFIALWDGKEGDGPGGTQHMIETVKKHLGQVSILQTQQIFA